jgi:alpha-glucosidase
MDKFKLASERSEFHFPPEQSVWVADYGSFRSHQETEFIRTKISEINPGTIIGCPLLVQLDDVWLALTEANLTDWAGVYFTRTGTAANAVVTLLSPRLDEPEVAVICQPPRNSPWRTLLIGQKPGDLIESNLNVNLNEPLAIEDPSWITPGISAWDRWWPGGYAPDFKDGQVGMSTDSMKYFVDFAAEMDWEYQLVDWTWYGPPFDPNYPFGLVGNPTADLSRSIPEIDIPGLVKYAADKGVRILVWLDWDNADKQMEKAFPVYEKWGVAGVKVDFMQRDDQKMVNYYHRLVKLAAKHKLTVDFHGAYKPTGFRRTFPNLLNREGVLGNEYNKWSSRITPEHNVTIPFTRMLCGPIDFTPGGFRHKSQGTFRAVGSDEPGPFVMGTRAHQLAMFVIFESPLQVAPDSPYSYRMSPAGLDFLKVVPTTWDDSKVLDGFPGQFIIMARKSGEDWLLGGMNADQPREVVLSLQFLGINPGKAIDVSEVLIEGDQVGSRFHRVCGNPDIVCGNRRSLTLELHCDPAEAVCRCQVHGKKPNVRVL